jgi:hypothetical protein
MKSLSARDTVFDIGQFHCKFAADPRVFPDGALSQSCYRYPCRLLIQFKPGGLALTLPGSCRYSHFGYARAAVSW